MMLFIAFAIGIWLLVMLVWYFLTRSVRASDAERMKTRLMGKQTQKASANTPALFETEQEPKGKIVIGLLNKYNLSGKIQDLIEQAGLKWNVARFAHGCMAGFIGGYLIGRFLLPAFMQPGALLVAFIGGSLPLLYVMRLRKARLHSFEAIFPDALEFISRSMRAGHAFSVSLEMIYREFQEPLASEFRRTFEEHNLGLPLDLALQKLSARIPLLDVQFFVSAVMLQKRTGGNLAEILDKLAYVIRERFKLRGRIRAVSAHGRITGICLTCIPMAVAVLMFFTNPPYITFFFEDEVGHILMGIAFSLQALAYLVIKKIVNIEV